MVTVLLSSTRVARRDLEMSFRDRTDPDFAPRRRDHQRAKSTDVLPLPDDATVRIDVRKASADSTPLDAGLRVRHIPKPCGFGGCCEIARRPSTHGSSRTWPVTSAPSTGVRSGVALTTATLCGGQPERPNSPRTSPDTWGQPVAVEIGRGICQSSPALWGQSPCLGSEPLARALTPLNPLEPINALLRLPAAGFRSRSVEIARPRASLGIGTRRSTQPTETTPCAT